MHSFVHTCILISCSLSPRPDFPSTFYFLPLSLHFLSPIQSGRPCQLNAHAYAHAEHVRGNIYPHHIWLTNHQPSCKPSFLHFWALEKTPNLSPPSWSPSRTIVQVSTSQIIQRYHYPNIYESSNMLPFSNSNDQI